MSHILNDKVVLVTGGTGSFGQKFVEIALRESQLKKLIIFSRDEWKQSQMAQRFKDDRLRFFLGDVRDTQRLQRAFHGVQIIIHAAALKQVPILEYNPFEAVRTNVLGAQNVINAAIDQGIEQVVALSTDKAVNPINLYGATKLCAEKLFIAGNAYAGGTTRFSVVRYGNVVGSRGSVIPLFLEKKRTGVLPLTHENMTRFWITLEQSARLVLTALEKMDRGDIFIPKLPSMRVLDLARAIAPECRIEVVGIRPGEKIHEILLTEEETSRALDLGDCIRIPPVSWEQDTNQNGGRPLPSGFRYSSDSNNAWLTPDQLSKMLEEVSP